MSVAVAVVAACWAGGACGGTIYVDWSNMSGTTDGLTPATAWTTIADGLVHLAATNAIVQGGHKVLVAEGAYNEAVIFAPEHSGVNGAPNILEASGAVSISGGSSDCIHGNGGGVHYIEVDGFTLTGGSDGIDFQYGHYDIVVRNCDVYGNSGHGIHMRYGSIAVSNCNVCFNGLTGIHTQSGINPGGFGLMAYNCNVAFNGAYGLEEGSTSPDLYASFCNIYGNGLGGYKEYGTADTYDTADAINDLTQCSNNVAGNPGFVDLSGGDFSRMYTNSPSMDAGPGGVTIGRHPTVTLLPLSSNTYYVAAGGDDSRLPGAATNPLTPWASITNAVAHVSAGDTVIVGPGTYAGQLTLTRGTAHGHPITYRGDADAVVDGDSYGILLNLAAEYRIEGFRLTSGTTAGLALDGAACWNILSNVTCSANAGYGFRAEADSFGNTFRDSTVCGNSGGGMAIFSYMNVCDGLNVCSNTGNGIYINTTGPNALAYALDRCSVHHNSGHGITSLYSSRNGKIRNCNIYANGGDGFRHEQYDYALQHCTIYSNGGHGIYIARTTALTVENCIVAANRSAGAYEGASGAEVYASFCDFYGNLAGQYYDNDTGGYKDDAGTINALAGCSNNVVADPLFAGVPDDLRLSPGSPCIDKGSPTADVPFDFYGSVRVVGLACDIGSHEFVAVRPAGLLVVIR